MGFKYEMVSSTVEETINFPVRRINCYVFGIYGPASFLERLLGWTNWLLAYWQSLWRILSSLEDNRAKGKNINPNLPLRSAALMKVHRYMKIMTPAWVDD